MKKGVPFFFSLVMGNETIGLEENVSQKHADDTAQFWGFGSTCLLCPVFSTIIYQVIYMPFCPACDQAMKGEI